MATDGRPAQSEYGHGAVGMIARLGTTVCGVKFSVEVEGRSSKPFQVVRKPALVGLTAVTLTASARIVWLTVGPKSTGTVTKNPLGSGPPKDLSRVSSRRVGMAFW